MNWIDSLDRKFGRHSIPHLMYFITGVMLAVYVTDLVLGGQVSAALYFDRSLILRGEVWRLVTFLFLPPNSSPIWILFSLYFYCLIGNGLESAWGSFRFNIFYLVGVLGAVCSGLITGYAANGFSICPFSGLCRHLSRPSGAGVLLPAHQNQMAGPVGRPVFYLCLLRGWLAFQACHPVRPAEHRAVLRR